MDIIPQLIVNSLITGSIYALASSGLSLCSGLLRTVNFAHGHLMMVGAYLLYFFVADLGFGFPVAAAAALALATVLSLGSLQLFVVPFSRSSPTIALVSTLGLGAILEAAVSMTFGVVVRSYPPLLDEQSIQFWSVFVTPMQIVIVATAIVLNGLLGYLVHCTSFGRTVRALSQDRHAAQSLGIHEQQAVRILFCLTGFTAALAGMMVGFETNLQPTMGNGYTIKAFASVLLGGMGNLWGTIFGSYLIGFVENFGIGLDFFGYSLPAGYRDAFSFAIILVALLFRPEGLFNARRRGV